MNPRISKKRKRAEFEEIKDEMRELKEDRWAYLKNVKRLRLSNPQPG